MILFTIVLQHFSSLLHEETGLEQFLSFAERMVQDSVVEVKIYYTVYRVYFACFKFSDTHHVSEN